jgi:tryptophanyl-tRNA synthetase
MEKTVVSGIKPTGHAHLGSYLGMMRNCVLLQENHKAFFFLADYHALTIEISAEELRHNTIRMATDMLAIGIDPKKSILFKQSDVPEHTELAWILNCLTPVSEL